MKIRNIEGIACLAAALLLSATMAAPIYADSAAASPWMSFTGQTWMDYSGSTPILNAVFANQSPFQVNGTAYAVLHDSLGQTIEIATAPITALGTGQNATVQFYINVPFDAYTVNFFVLSDAGTAISAGTNSTVVA